MRLLLLIVALFCLLPCVPAQETAVTSEGATSLQETFEEMVRRSTRYRGQGKVYRVVPETGLNGFIGQVNDSIRGYTERIGELEAELAMTNERVEDQLAELGEREAEIRELNAEKDSVSLLGIPLSKALYSIIMWGLVIGLVALLLLALGRARVAVSSAGELRDHNEKLSADLEQSRKQRLTVEQKLRRELQDERNRNKQ